MRAEELRIGNYYNHNGEIKKVTQSLIQELFESERTWCKPIELTEDLKTKIFSIFNSEYRIEWKNNRVNIYFNERYLATCDYLHEYQNAHFILTNQELTINL